MRQRRPVEKAMQTRNKIFDDISQLMTNAMGVAQGARDEAQNAMKSLMDRWLADRDLVTREEFEAVRAMAQKAREENAALSARIAALEQAAGGTKPAPRKAAARPAARPAAKGAGKTAP
jgi:BMFP domain-containing protein YqiC